MEDPVSGKEWASPVEISSGLVHPVYLNRSPPCNVTCPAGENVQGWLDWVRAENYQEAWRTIMRDNPLPAVHGRVCYHPCENACNRKHLDAPVSIHAVERFLGDLAIQSGWSVAPGPPTGKKILVIGSGPCGLSVAFHLRLLGHGVCVHEAADQLGGMMRYGIPEYRLPRNVLDAEIDRIARMGVEFKTGAKVDQLDDFVKEHRFDAVFLAIGANLSKRVDIPADDARRIVDALKLLADPQSNAGLCVGRRVVIYGGGNTAMDAARTALRMGASESLIIYRRDVKHMPAHLAELEEAQAEGVKVHWLRTIKKLEGGQIEVEAMRLDAKGKPQPTGETEIIPADAVVLALGQQTHSDFLKDIPGLKIVGDGAIEVDEQMMTGYPGIFAGGDMIPENKTVTTAVGHGKKAARCLDGWLGGKSYVAPPKHAIAKFGEIKMNWFPTFPRGVEPTLDLAARQASFAETTGGLERGAAHEEARRCFSCGNCFACDTCYDVCPDQAIVKQGSTRRYEIDMNYCSRCGLCAQECPCAAIAMIQDAAGR